VNGDRFDWWAKAAVFQAVLTGVLGLGCLAIPAPLLTLFGCAPHAGTVVFFRAFGASLLFVSAIHLALRRSRDPALVRALVLANALEDGLLAIFSVHATLTGAFGSMGWALVAAFGAEVAFNAWIWSRFRDPAPA